MIKHKDSHLDHHISTDQLAHLLERFAGRDAHFVETVELPPELGTVPCGLHGPTMGDPPITRADWERRPGRAYASRLVERPKRPSRLVTVVAGPHDGHPCVLYTAYGGPRAPREVADPTMPDHELAESVHFWSEHALSRPEVGR